MPRYLSELFEECPRQYGLRGDEHFWKYLEGYFSTIEFPHSEDWLTDDIYRKFKEVSGVQLTVDAQPYVEEFAHGGMSSGVLSGEFWITRAIPLIVGRYRNLMEQFGLQVYVGKNVHILSTNGKEYVGPIIDFTYAEDNPSGEDDIVLEKDKEFLISFTAKDIKSIRVLKTDVERFNGCPPEVYYDGKIQKFRLITNGLCYGPCPEPTDEVEQHLTITRDGRVWFSGYNFGTWGINKYVQGRKLQFKLSEEKVAPIFEAFQDYFSMRFMPYFATDIGDWEMKITTDTGDEATFNSSYGSPMYYQDKHLSQIVAEILEIEDLWVFGCIEEYAYCSVYYSGCNRPYYYISDDDDIEIGDYVIVPVGASNKETVGKVADISYFYEDDVPFPIEDTKHIIRKCDRKDLEGKLDELWKMPVKVKSTLQNQSEFDSKGGIEIIPPGDEKYDTICKKLGFVPSEYKPEASDYEDDSRVSPFSKLDTDELLYLFDNGYLKMNKD